MTDKLPPQAVGLLGSIMGVMEICKLDIHVTPFRGDKFQELWAPAVPKVMDYGAKGFALTREEDDPLHFVQMSIWESRLGFDYYWNSDEMTKLKTECIGIYQVPLLPHWSELVSFGSELRTILAQPLVTSQ